MKTTDLMKILGEGKLHLTERMLTFGLCYDLTFDAILCHLPRLVVLPPLDAETVPVQVVQECAGQLGVTPGELDDAVSCNIGRTAILLAIAVTCHEARKRYHLNPNHGWPSKRHPLGEIIGRILAEIDSSTVSYSSPEESKLLKRLHNRRFARCPVGKKIDRRIRIQLTRVTSPL